VGCGSEAIHARPSSSSVKEIVMPQLTPLRTGAAFALTVAVLYVACLLAVWLAPGTVLVVFSTWVHGLNLEPLTTNAPPLVFSRALLGLLLISAYFFIAGVVYGFVRQRLSPARAPARG
jgi:hypothetical protein